MVVTYIKSNHILSYLLYQFLMRLGLQETISYSGGITRILIDRTVVRRLFDLMSFLDTISIIGKFMFTVYLPYHLGCAVLIEEGLLMSLQSYLMSYPLVYGTPPKLLPFLPRLLGWIAKMKYLTIVIDATDEELHRRRRNRSYRRDELPEFVYLQRKGIETLTYGNAVFVDTTGQTIESIHKQITKAIERILS